MSDKKKPTMSPDFRVSYPSVFKPSCMMIGGKAQGEPSYSVVMLIPKTDVAGLERLKKLLKETVAEVYPKGPPSGFRSALRDGDKEKADKPEYKGMMFATARARNRPGLVDANKQEIIDPGEFYPGCWARATLTAFCYDKTVNKGVSLGLNNVQKLRDDESFTSRTTAEDDFGPATGEAEKGAITEAKDDWLNA